jgi:hypothetical protein
MGFLRGLAKVTAGFLSFLFVIALVLSLFLVCVQWKLMDPVVYAQALEEQGFYEHLPALAAQQIVHGMTYNPCEEDPSLCEGEGPMPGGGQGEEEGGGPPLYFRLMSESDWQSLLTDLLPADWLQAQVESALYQFFGALRQGTESLSVKISLVELKNRLRGDEGVQAVIRIISNLPPCGPEFMLDPSQPPDLAQMSEALMACRPPDELLPTLTGMIQGALYDAVDGIPEEIDLTGGIFGGGEMSGAATSDGLRMLRMVLMAAVLTPLLPLGLLLLVTVLAVRSLRGLLRWWGIPLLIGALLAVLLAIIGRPLIDWGLQTYVVGQASAMMSSEIMVLAVGVLRGVLSSYLSWVALTAGIMGGIGLVMLVVSFFVGRRR